MLDFSRQLSLVLLLVTGCLSCVGKSESETNAASPATVPIQACEKDFNLPIPSGSTGVAKVYRVDPAASSGNSALSPGSATVGNFTEEVQLEHLLGRGTLNGAYVEVVSGYCGYAPGAFHARNEFLYSYGDGRFAEAMSYFHADRFRSRLNQVSALLPADPIRLIANCPYEDNAFYMRDENDQGSPIDLVCMGRSSRFSQGNLSHDAQVVIHELQHATTTHAYNPNVDLNRLLYDDAGSINEGASDFVGLMLTEEHIPNGMNSRVFSRWALGALISNQARGATRCPVYDSTYPDCGQYQIGAAGFSSESNRVSFSYPDGLGWPMASNRSGPAFVRNHFLANRAAEEIHQNGIIAAGVLWDAYVNLKDLMSMEQAQNRMLKLLTETLRALPMPNSTTDVSPVTYPIFGEKLLQTAALLGWSAPDQAALKKATDERGLTSAPQLTPGWASIGPGKALSPGLHIIDHSTTGTHQANGRLNRGDVAAVFFDIRNNQAITAGSILLDVVTTSAVIRVLDYSYNEGYVSSSRAMVRYAKVNGTAIAAALSSANSTYHVPTGNTYFLTNPRYSDSQAMTTPLYVQIPTDAALGQTQFTVRIKPANGAEVTLVFPVEIHP